LIRARNIRSREKLTMREHGDVFFCSVHPWFRAVGVSKRRTQAATLVLRLMGRCAGLKRPCTGPCLEGRARKRYLDTHQRISPRYNSEAKRLGHALGCSSPVHGAWYVSCLIKKIRQIRKKLLTNTLHLPKQARICSIRRNKMSSAHLNTIVIIAAAGSVLSSLLLLLLVGSLKLPGLIMA
jgi:hypothetical protein